MLSRGRILLIVLFCLSGICANAGTKNKVRHWGGKPVPLARGVLQTPRIGISVLLAPSGLVDWPWAYKDKLTVYGERGQELATSVAQGIAAELKARGYEPVILRAVFGRERLLPEFGKFGDFWPGVLADAKGQQIPAVLSVFKIIGPMPFKRVDLVDVPFKQEKQQKVSDDKVYLLSFPLGDWNRSFLVRPEDDSDLAIFTHEPLPEGFAPWDEASSKKAKLFKFKDVAVWGREVAVTLVKDVPEYSAIR